MVSIETGRVKDHCIVDKRYTRVGRDMIRMDKILACIYITAVLQHMRDDYIHPVQACDLINSMMYNVHAQCTWASCVLSNIS